MLITQPPSGLAGDGAGYGFQVAREFRQNPETRGLTIVAVSGYGQDEDRRRASEAGIDHYFTKPMDIDALERLLSG